uniref:NADH-ubiquinone oxidoreductase chain 2 n=1 Tax=Gekko crombota TaxID=655675 RepID=C7AFM4_9SAUR|nr:NADH dehydrogenase subunit 2 [Gekko crombota]ACT35720.1 NADH dehydrogenase subunit 2 [Gekko crombota]ACT35721.1 NADH dehydrogenase subunit 2 [Gekko crombota]
MNPMMWSLFITSLTTSTIITAASHHWLLAWLGLELNTMSALPIIMTSHHPRAIEAATKYFLIQTPAAALMLFASTMNAWQTGHWSIMQTTTPMTTTIVTIALLMKLGLAPMHAWYPEVLQGSTLNTAMIISTWQKLAPLSLLYLMNTNLPTNITLTLGLTSALVGGWAGLNQTQTRKIMAYSSIAHMGWLSTMLTLNLNITTLTLVTYIIMTTTLFMMMNMTTTKTLTDLGTMWSQSPPLTTMMMLTLMALGGLPPLTGFVPKWLILDTLCQMKLLLLSTTLVMAGLPSLFFYIRMAYFTTLTTPPTTTGTQQKWRFKTKMPTGLMVTTTCSTLLLPLLPLMITM